MISDRELCDAYKPAEELFAALAAADSEGRKALLAAATPAVREALRLQILYRRVIDGDPDQRDFNREFAEFTAALAAPDAAARVELLKAARADPRRGGVWLAEWDYMRTASTEDLQRRYQAFADGEIDIPCYKLR